MLEEAEAKDEVLTGVLYVNTSKPTFVEALNLANDPLATLPESKTRPPQIRAGHGDGGASLGISRKWRRDRPLSWLISGPGGC